MYSFERGVGFTKSCGSGTIACSLVINNFFEKRDVWDIRSTGGTLRIIKEGEMYWLLTKVSQIS
jgi:diaminopimelate epimerase